jgi:hypothetical protein
VVTGAPDNEVVQRLVHGHVGESDKGGIVIEADRVPSVPAGQWPAASGCAAFRSMGGDGLEPPTSSV